MGLVSSLKSKGLLNHDTDDLGDLFTSSKRKLYVGQCSSDRCRNNNAAIRFVTKIRTFSRTEAVDSCPTCRSYLFYEIKYVETDSELA